MNKDIVERALDRMKGAPKTARGTVEGREIEVTLRYNEGTQKWVTKVYVDGILAHRACDTEYEAADRIFKEPVEEHGLEVWRKDEETKV